MEKNTAKKVKTIRAELALAGCVIGVAVFLLNARSAFAANFYLSPSAGNYGVGETFSVAVGVATADQVMNAASGTVSFSPDLLEATSVSKTGSIIGLWVQDPAISSDSVNFGGIVLNPGFSGTGKVIVINFKAKSAGEAKLSFASGSILANDGKGTNIVSGLGKAVFEIGAAAAGPPPALPKATPPPQPKPATAAPAAPIVASSTNPDPKKWYNFDKPVFNWPLPAGTTGVSVFVDDKDGTVPWTKSDGLFGAYASSHLDDGAWYLHVRLENSVGWGPAAHFRFQIDTVPPTNLSLRMSDQAASSDFSAQPAVYVSASDPMSGIGRYEIALDGNAPIVLGPTDVSNDKAYVLPSLNSGKHHIAVSAFDNAENKSSISSDFTVQGAQKPVLTQYPERLCAGDWLVVRGTTGYADVPVKVWFERNNTGAQSQTVRADDQGNFTFVGNDRVTEGIYKVWAEVANQQGASGNASDKATIIVQAAPFLSIATDNINLYLVVIPLIALLLLNLFLLWRVRRHVVVLRKKMKKDADETEKSVRAAFDILKENVYDKIRSLESIQKMRKLTAAEERTIKEFKKNLTEAERVVDKKIGKTK